MALPTRKFTARVCSHHVAGATRHGHIHVAHANQAYSSLTHEFTRTTTWVPQGIETPHTVGVMVGVRAARHRKESRERRQTFSRGALGGGRPQHPLLCHLSSRREEAGKS